MLKHLLPLIALVFSFSLNAQNLIKEEVDPNTQGVSQSLEIDNPTISKYRYVRLNEFETGANLSIQLFPDKTVSAVYRSNDFQELYSSWIGDVLGGELPGQVLLTKRDGFYHVKVYDGFGGVYLIQHRKDDVYVVKELADYDYPEENCQAIALKDDDAKQERSAVTVCDEADTCEVRSLTLLMVYTDSALNAIGGLAAMNAAMAAAVTEMNTINSNSGVKHNFVLNHSDSVPYVESGSYITDLIRLRTMADGFMDTVHGMRDFYNCDMVCLISNGGGSCGIGYLNTNPTTYFSDLAFSVTRYSCMTGNLTLPHEIGHNVGLRHDWFVDTDTTPCHWHHGYVNQRAFDIGASVGQRWRTVLAYNDQCSANGFTCTRLPYWSNTTELYTVGLDSDSMGRDRTVQFPADNAYALGRALCLATEFRLPVEMLFFNAEAVEGSKAQLKWATASELNAEGFEIQMVSKTSLNTVENIGWIDAAGTSSSRLDYSFTTKSLGPGVYLFRLKQVDFDGRASYTQWRTVHILSDDDVLVDVQPNPSTGKIMVEVAKKVGSHLELNLLDVNGRLVKQLYQGDIVGGLSRLEFDLKGLSSGIYLLQAKLDNGESQSQKLVLH